MSLPRAVYVRRRVTVGTAITLVLGAILYGSFTLLAPLSPARLDAVATPDQALAGVTVEVPGYGASAIGLVDGDDVLARGGSTRAQPLASITKVVSALVVLDAKPLDPDEDGPTITTTSRDVAFYDQVIAHNGSSAPVRPGLRLSERDLLDLALVPSASNYVLTLVTWAFGSEDAFVKAADAWIAEQGFASLRLVEATGIDPRDEATADEVVELGRLALADPTIAAIVAQDRISIPGVGRFDNTNDLLGVDGIDGIKTGTLDIANLLFSADVEIEGETFSFVGVVLGGKDHPTIDLAIRRMLQSAEAGFQRVTLVTAGEELGTLSTPWGETASIIASEDASVVIWADGAVTRKARLDDLTLGQDGDAAGELVASAGGQTVTVPLELDGQLEDPGPWWRLTHPGFGG